MEDRNSPGQNQEDQGADEASLVMCPYLQIPCVSFCPGWFDEFSDCVFRLCMTQVRQTFSNVLEYMCRKYDLRNNMADEALRGMRDMFLAGEEEKAIRVFLNSGFAGAAAQAGLVLDLGIDLMRNMLSGGEAKICFGLLELFGVQKKPESDPE